MANFISVFFIQDLFRAISSKQAIFNPCRFSKAETKFDVL